MSLSAAEQFIDDAISSHQTKTTNFGGDGDLNIVVENKLQVVERVERVILAKAVAPTDGKFRTDRGEPKSVSLSRRWRVVGQLV
jgi:hypothetical protein